MRKEGVSTCRMEVSMRQDCKNVYLFISLSSESVWAKLYVRGG